MIQGYKKYLIIIEAIIVILVMGIVIFRLYLNSKTTLKITSKPENIGVVVNHEIYQTPVVIKVKSGTLRIEGFKEGYKDQVQNIKIRAGKENSLQIDLEIETQPEPPEGAPILPEPTPQISNLPYSSDHFKVDWDTAYSKYLIVPNIPFTASDSPQNQIKNNWATYKQYGLEAIAWIKSQGVKPTPDNLEWWGQEWWPEGKTISF